MRGKAEGRLHALSKRIRPHLLSAHFRPDISIDWDAWPFCIPAVRDMEQLAFHPNVTFLVGENGSGKSTVLEALAQGMGFSPEGGTKNVRLNTAGDTEALSHCLRLARAAPMPTDSYSLRAESFYNVATYMDAMDLDSPGYGDKPLHQQSHGESFMAVLMHKLRGNGLYFLDEPEAALSPARQLAALRLIDQLVHRQSQFIIATHSPLLLAYPHAQIYLLDGSGLTPVAYEDTEHYALTRDFLNHYPQRLARLLGDDQAHGA